MNTITMICPIYNSSKYLQQLLTSINEQTFRDFNVIFVDDGSTDNSVSIIQKFNCNFEYSILTQENSGAPAARNNGLNFATGKYIYLFDSDDILVSSTLENLVWAIRESNADLVIGNLKIYDENNEIELNDNKDYSIISLNDSLYLPPTPGVHLFKKSLIDEYHIQFSDLRIGQDLNFVLKYISCCKKIVKLNSDVYVYRVDSPGISRTYSTKIKDIVKSLEEAETYFDERFKYDFTKLKLEHYSAQFSKFKFLKSFNDRREIYHYFLDKILQIKSYSYNFFILKCKYIFLILIKYIYMYQ